MTPRIEPLTQQSFKPFGQVVETAGTRTKLSLNQGFTTRFHDLVDIDTDACGGRLGVSICRCEPMPMPVHIQTLERQPLSSLTLMPLGNLPYLVVVAPPGEFIESNIRVFLANGRQGVHYRAGTWHNFCLALYRTCDFLVLDRLGKGKNGQKIHLKKGFYIRTGDF